MSHNCGKLRETNQYEQTDLNCGAPALSMTL